MIVIIIIIFGNGQLRLAEAEVLPDPAHGK